jgi:hypothetical protein
MFFRMITLQLSSAIAARIAVFSAFLQNDYMLKKHGGIAEDSILLIDTGSGKFWPNRKEYMGADERGQEGVPGQRRRLLRRRRDSEKISACRPLTHPISP